MLPGVDYLALIDKGGREMGTVAALGGSNVCASSSFLRSPNRTYSLSNTNKPILCASLHHELSAFPSKSHLFSYCPSRPYAKTSSRGCSTNPGGIFLPILIASMVLLCSPRIETPYLLLGYS